MGVIGNGKTTNDTLPLLQGTATAGASVTIYQNGASIATVTADAVSGAWSYQLLWGGDRFCTVKNLGKNAGKADE